MSEEDRILEHFIAGWMRFMGYGSNANKRYFMYRVKFMSSPEMISQLTKVYRNLSLLGMSRSELRSFLLNTCKHGWEYFVRGILSHLRLLQSEARWGLE